MSQKIFFWFLFYFLKYCQTLLISSDDSFYFYDDGSLNPFSKLEQDLEDTSKPNAFVKNVKSDNELNENLNLYKDLAQQLRKSLDSFQSEESKGMGTSNENYLNMLPTQNRKVLKKEVKNSKNILVNEMESNSDDDNNEGDNIPFDNSIPIQTNEQPSLLQRIKEKFDNVFHRATNSSEFVRSDEPDLIKENNTQSIHPKPQKTYSEINDKKLKGTTIKSRSINEIFDKRTVKQKHDNQNLFTSEEMKVLKNFVKFVKENKNVFTNSETEITAVNKTFKPHSGSAKQHETTTHMEHSNKKQDHHNSIKHHKNTTAKISAGDSVKLNISVTELDDDENKKNEAPKQQKTKEKSNDSKPNSEGCPFNFDNMDIEMEFKEEENNGKEKFPDCKGNVKDMKTKINLNSRLNPKDNIKEITEDYNKIDSNLYKRLQSDISENVNNLKNMRVLDFQQEENLGIEEDRPLRQYHELMSSEIDHQFLTGSKPLRTNSNPPIDNKKNKEIYDPKPTFNSNRTNVQYEGPLSKDNIFSDVSFKELQRFKELIEKRLKRIESENKYNEIHKGNLNSLPMVEKNLQSSQGQYGMNRFRKKRREKNLIRKQDKLISFYNQQVGNEKYKGEEKSLQS